MTFITKLNLGFWSAHRWSLNLVYHHHHPPTTGTLCVVVVRPSVQRRHLEHFPVFNQIIHNIVIAPRFKARRLEDVSNPCRLHMYSIVNNQSGLELILLYTVQYCTLCSVQNCTEQSVQLFSSEQEIDYHMCHMWTSWSGDLVSCQYTLDLRTSNIYMQTNVKW